MKFGANHLKVSLIIWNECIKKTDSDWLKEEISRYMSILPCPACKGERLRKESLAVKISNHNIAQITAFSIIEAENFFKNIKLTKDKKNN